MRLSFLLFLFAFFGACGKDAEIPSEKRIYYAYGNHPLPGALPPLLPNYRPLHLDSKTFTVLEDTYSPLDILAQDLSLTADVQSRTLTGKALIQFQMSETARPFFELQAFVKELRLDGVPVVPLAVPDPDGQGQTFWSIPVAVSSGATHELEIDYEVFHSKVDFADGGVRLLTHMTDLNNSNFFEYWGPVGLEDDQYGTSLSLKVLNQSSVHRVFTNGSVTDLSPNEWVIEFPDYFTKSSFYLHLTNAQDLHVKRFEHQGLDTKIPVVVYGSSLQTVEEAARILPSLFHEFETDYGPYPHLSFTAYMNRGRGGMEHSGATITTLGALDHELFHSWFARSVMPAEGRSGWIDEALASWRDYGYFQAPTLLTRPQTNLAGFSPFKESTPSNCYKDGRELIAELDREFMIFGGMKPLLKIFFERYKNKVVTNEEFWNFLGGMTQMNVDEYFMNYTLGTPGLAPSRMSLSKHPARLTQEEIARLR